jgi:hypothetical protein
VLLKVGREGKKRGEEERRNLICYLFHKILLEEKKRKYFLYLLNQ